MQWEKIQGWFAIHIHQVQEKKLRIIFIYLAERKNGANDFFLSDNWFDTVIMAL